MSGIPARRPLFHRACVREALRNLRKLKDLLRLLRDREYGLLLIGQV